MPRLPSPPAPVATAARIFFDAAEAYEFAGGSPLVADEAAIPLDAALVEAGLLGAGVSAEFEIGRSEAGSPVVLVLVDGEEVLSFEL